MGKPTAKGKSGLYAMKSPADATPEAAARSSGVLGSLEGSSDGEAYGVGGLGLVGTGRGGGGVGEGTIGLGSTGVIGKGGGGSGSGYGSGFGRSRSGFDRNLQGRTLTVGTVDDFSDARAWATATQALAPAAKSLGISDAWLDMPGPGQRHVDEPDALDVALVLDTTGSMGDELEYLKVELRDIAEEVERRFPAVDQRWGLVVYRDHSDAYTVRAEDLADLETMVEGLARQHAGGGGDFPEAMDMALARSEQLDWRRDRETARMVFLVADAPPHSGRAAERFLDAVQGHRNAGTAIYPVSASGVDDAAEVAMRVAARATGGQYIYLTDHSGIGGTHKKPHTEETKIETLHDVMIRMIATELGDPAPGSTEPPEPPTTVDPPAPPSSIDLDLDRPAPASPAPAARVEADRGPDDLLRRLGEHFLFAMGMSLAVFAAMGIDTFRRRRAR